MTTTTRHILCRWQDLAKDRAKWNKFRDQFISFMEKEQDVRQTEYSNALTKHYNALSTQKRKEHERIASEIQEKYKAKMTRLREDMETRRKAEIAKIEAKKNRTIEELK